MTRNVRCLSGLLCTVVFGAGCARAGLDLDAPDWVAALVAELEREPVANPPALIARYEYKGDTVYYVPPKCCDVPSVLYDATGTVLCGPDGGLTGRGDGRCTDFFTERRNEKIIWRDKRTGP